MKNMLIQLCYIVAHGRICVNTLFNVTLNAIKNYDKTKRLKRIHRIAEKERKTCHNVQFEDENYATIC